MSKSFLRSLVLSLFVIFAFMVYAATAKPNLTPAEARAIAQEAYIYGYPMVDSYRIQYAYFVDRNSPEFKAPWNVLKNIPRVYTPADTAVQTPNSDTPYSMLGADLRAEPLVLTVPAIDHDRYFSLQFVDLYTYNFAYIGSRTTGNGGGHFLLAGPHWHGETPAGIKEVIRTETDFALVIYRTQLFNPADLDKVKQIQAGYQVQPLSAFLGKRTQPTAPPLDFIQPLTPEQQRTAPEFFDILNFILQQCPTNPSEAALMARFRKLGIGHGEPFDFQSLSPEIQQAVTAGIADAWQTFETFKKTEIDTGKVTSGALFGTRAHLQNNYLYRMAGAVLGIFGNSQEEAMYPFYTLDANGKPLDGSAHRYTVHFGPDELPPANAFWSLTMYGLPDSLLVANPLDRYLINSPMLPNLQKDADGGVTIFIQHDSPGSEKEANWLPAPDGPFFVALRIYWPKPAALDGTWKQPPLMPTALTNS